MLKRLEPILGVFESIVALGAIPAGLSLIADPTGTGLGLAPEILEGTPFQNYLIPGLFLLLVNGFGNVAGAFYSFKRKKLSAELGLILGILLLGWILIQVYLIGWTNFLQTIFFIVAIVEIVLSLVILRKEKQS